MFAQVKAYLENPDAFAVAAPVADAGAPAGDAPAAAEEKKEEEEVTTEVKGEQQKRKKVQGGATMMQAEERNTGAVPGAIYKEYMKAGKGGIVIPVLIISLVFLQGAQVMSSYW